VGKEVGGGTVSSQGAPEGKWRWESSLVRGGVGVKGGMTPATLWEKRAA